MPALWFFWLFRLHRQLLCPYASTGLNVLRRSTLSPVEAYG